MGRANQRISGAMIHPRGSNPWAEGVNAVTRAISDASPKIIAARDELLRFLSSEI